MQFIDCIRKPETGFVSLNHQSKSPYTVSAKDGMLVFDQPSTCVISRPSTIHSTSIQSLTDWSRWNPSSLIMDEFNLLANCFFWAPQQCVLNGPEMRNLLKQADSHLTNQSTGSQPVKSNRTFMSNIMSLRWSWRWWMALNSRVKNECEHQLHLLEMYLYM